MQLFSTFLVFFHLYIVFEYVSVLFGGFLTFRLKLKAKMADPRWRLFGHHDVVVTQYDVISARDVCQKIDFWTYYIPFKFHCHCFNILEVTERWGESPSPGLKRSKKARSE